MPTIIIYSKENFYSVNKLSIYSAKEVKTSTKQLCFYEELYFYNRPTQIVFTSLLRPLLAARDFDETESSSGSIFSKLYAIMHWPAQLCTHASLL